MSDQYLSKEGFSYVFDPSACAACKGNCCSGEHGYIWVSAQQIPKIAAFLHLSSEDFRARYLQKVGYRFSLKEHQRAEGVYDCIFFDPTTYRCQIYPVRPLQCRTYPFWDHFKEHEEIVKAECPGIFPNS